MGDDTQETSADAACWRFGDAVLDERTLELRVRGELRPLARKPLELLMFLVRNPGEVVTREELFQAVWPGRIVSETSLTNAIVRLRTALDDEQQVMIRSVYGYGYRLMAEVVRETPLREAPPPPSFDFHPGLPVPLRTEWLLERALGGGASGEVWLARHKATREHRVFKFARDGNRLTSLKREITLFRLMRDTLGTREDLLPIVDWNLDEAPYFLCQPWCTGGSLAQWADGQGGIDKVPLEQRLDLVVQAAEALAAAHSAGVLHKDLKPANLLIDLLPEGRLRLKLADFGSARLVDQHRLETYNITRLGFTMTAADTTSATPAYLAPEVLMGQPPTALSDIYALGVVLYQMTVGNLRRSLAPGWEREIADELLRQDIALAAAGNPAERLSDAMQLAQRLRSLELRRAEHRAAQEREARAAHAQRQLERARARRGLLTALFATMAAALLSISVLLWQSRRARSEARAEATRATAISDFLSEDLLSAANPLVAGRRDVMVRDVLDTARARLQSRFADDALTRAKLLRVIGAAYAAMGERTQAEPLLATAVGELDRLSGTASSEAQAARMNLRNLYISVGAFPKATDIALQIWQAEVDAGRPHSEIAYDNIGMHRIATCWLRYGSERVARCQDMARAIYEEARDALGPDSYATLHLSLSAGITYARVGRYREALPYVERARDGIRRLFPRDYFWLLQTDGVYAETLIGGGRLDDAQRWNEQQVLRNREIYGSEHRLTLATRRWLARARLELGELVPAAEELRDVFRKVQSTSTASPTDLWLAAFELAQAELRLQRPQAADEVLRMTLDRLRASEPDGGYWTLRLRELLADSLIARGRQQDAAALLRTNYADAQRRYRDNEWLLGWCAYRLGGLLAGDGRTDEARALLQEARTVLEISLGADDERARKAAAALAALIGRS